MQLSVVAAVRNLLDIKDANSTEVDPLTAHPVVRIPEERVTVNDSRRAARMGRQEIELSDGIVKAIYGKDVIAERHGNRYEVDTSVVAPLAEKGFVFSGVSVEDRFPEVFEMKDHPFYVGTIYHPEFISRPNKPHPLFVAFLRAALQ